jgi:hypothetical protein
MFAELPRNQRVTENRKPQHFHALAEEKVKSLRALDFSVERTALPRSFDDDFQLFNMDDNVP